nr:hypothetical protein [Paenibacillus xylanexedens]
MGLKDNIDFERNDRVLIENTENCPSAYSKYLNKIGTISIIDDLTYNGVAHIGVSFVLDEELHAAHYRECKENKIIPLKPHITMFQPDNLRVV